jgi:hypothetical protein
MPALACVVTNHSCLVKQRRAVSDLNLVGGISARGYEGAGAFYGAYSYPAYYGYDDGYCGGYGGCGYPGYGYGGYGYGY